MIIETGFQTNVKTNSNVKYLSLGFLDVSCCVICGFFNLSKTLNLPYLTPKSIRHSVCGTDHRRVAFGVCFPSQINNLMQTSSKTGTKVRLLHSRFCLFSFLAKCKQDINMLSSAKVLKGGESACLYAINLKLQCSTDMQTVMPSHLLWHMNCSQTFRHKASFSFDLIRIQPTILLNDGGNSLNCKACRRNNPWKEKLTR